MTDLITVDKRSGELLLDSRVAARELGIEHESVMRLCQERPELGIAISDFKSEMVKRSQGGGKRSKYVLLTEEQALLLITMVRNTDEAMPKKQALVRAFLAMRDALNETKIARAVRRELTDSIQMAGLNERMHGFAYKSLTDLVYKAVLGMDAKRFREAQGLEADANVREHLTPIQTVAVERLEKLVGSMVELGADYDRIKSAVVAFGVPLLGDAGRGAA